MQTQTRPQPPQTKRPDNSNNKVDAATLLIPLRLFLGVSFIAAGLDKTFDPAFFDAQEVGYIGNQLKAFSKGSPIGGLLLTASDQATLAGIGVVAGELAIGLGTLVGLFSRVAAIFGAILSLTLWLSATWETAPFFLGSDLPYAIGWITLALVGAHPVWSLDAQISKWWKTRNQPVVAVPQYNPGNQNPQQTLPNPRQPLPVAAPDSNQRRRFIAVAGAAVLTGGVTGVAWLNSTLNRNITSSGSVSQAPIETTTAVPSVAASTPVFASTTTPAATTTNPATTSNPTTTSGATTPATTTQATTTTTAPKTTTAPAVSGTVLTTLTALPVGSTKTFTTPDSKESAILIRTDTNTVTAFSNVCTHEGCEVSYSKSQTLLVCPCHGAAYNPKTGAAVRRPATTALKSFKVTVDASGNIVYTK